MSDQISEKMANEIFDANEQFNAAGLCSGRERFISALKHFGLIKPSKLDEAREWCDSVRGTSVYDGEYDDGYRTGVLAAEARFEAAITEIMEEQNGPR